VRKRNIVSIVLTVIMMLSITSNVFAGGNGDNSTTDYGPNPYVASIEEITRNNPNFREAVWTGDNLQLVVMTIPQNDDIGVEIHEKDDQFLYIVEGSGTALMGDSDKNMDFSKSFQPGSGIFIPAGKWHNIVNTGLTPHKLYRDYAPPHHENRVNDKTKK